MVRVGHLGRSYGVRGWVHVHSAMDPPGLLCEYGKWYLRRGEGWSAVIVEKSRVQSNGVVAKLDHLHSREDVQAVVGVEIGLERDSFPPTEDDEFYWCDLIGASVVKTDGRELGRVERLIETGAHDVMVITPAAGSRSERGDSGDILLPFAFGAVVVEVDLKVGKVVVS